MLTPQDPIYRKDSGLVRRPGEGTRLGSTAEQVEIRLWGTETGGAWALVETVLPPHSAGPPLHLHTREDELLYVLDGPLLVQLGGRQAELTAGCLGYLPRGLAHTFSNPYPAPARFLGFIAPAGLEHFFAARAALAPPTWAS